MVDIEFCAQYLQLVGAADGGPLRRNTADALAALREARPEAAVVLGALEEAWRLQQSVSQLLKIALEDAADPAVEPPAFRALLAKAAGQRSFGALKRRLIATRKAAHTAFEQLTRIVPDKLGNS